jgi:hypothetical protein
MRISNPSGSAKGFIELVGFIQTNAGALASMGSETYELDPPAGFAYRLMYFDFYAQAPPASTVGSHVFSLKTALATMGANRYNVVYAFGDDMEMDGGLWQGAPLNIDPTTATAHLLIIPQVWCNNGEPITFKYENLTDVSQGNFRRYRGQYAKYAV